MSSLDIWIIALEFGGQSIKAARINSEGTLKGPFRFRVDQEHPPIWEDFLNQLAYIIQKAKEGEEISGVGIGAPSPYDADTLTFHLDQKPGYRHINGVSLKTSILEKAGCKSYYVENDAFVAARGEIWQGKKISSQGKYMFLTLGTGLGGCYISDGEIIKGEDIGGTKSGEIWDYQFQGKNLEDIIGTTKSMVRIYKDLGGENFNVIAGDIKLLAEMAKRGEELAIDSFRKFGNLLGKGLSEPVLKFGPEAVVLSGNISHAYEFFGEEANKSLAGSKPFLKSDLIDKGGLLGAAYMVLKNIYGKDFNCQKRETEGA